MVQDTKLILSFLEEASFLYDYPERDIPREDAKNLHNQIIKDLLVLLAKLVESSQNNKLDVVVSLLNDKFDVAGSGG